MLPSRLSALTEQPCTAFITQFQCINKGPAIHHCQYWSDPRFRMEGTGGGNFEFLKKLCYFKKYLPPKRQKKAIMCQKVLRIIAANNQSIKKNNLPLLQPTHLNISAWLERMWSEASATSECVCFSTLCDSTSTPR